MQFRILQYIIVYFLVFFTLEAYPSNNAIKSNLKKLHYVLTYNNNHEIPKLNISLIFNSGVTNSTTLECPSESAGSIGLCNNISDLVITGAEIIKANDSSTFILSHKPHSKIIINYNIQRVPAPLTDISQFYAPVLQNTYFQYRRGKGNLLLLV